MILVSLLVWVWGRRGKAERAGFLHIISASSQQKMRPNIAVDRPGPLAFKKIFR
jgi:hypothetical protein